MAEIPEIIKYSRQMDTVLSGKKISSLTLLQEKNLNIPPDEFIERCLGRTVKSVGHKGKWFVLRLDGGENILISLGMGADILYFEDGGPQGKYQVRLDFAGGTGFSIRYWWFGRFLLVTDEELPNERSTKDIGLDPFDLKFSYEHFKALFAGKKTQIKAFLLDQKNIGGIGNMYMHDILFLAGLHPKTKISDMKEESFQKLYKSILQVLKSGLDGGTFDYEMDFFGNPGPLTNEHFIIAYRENGHCPDCGSTIEFIKTGSTSSYICPQCQML